jgi:hypothetical protein
MKNLIEKDTKKVVYGISFPKKFWDKIDSDRSDVSRSRFLLRLAEKGYDYSSFDVSGKTNIK